MFLMDNLWTIFEVAKEERTDGDAVNSDLSYAPALILPYDFKFTSDQIAA